MVHFVGAGPGASDLITVRGDRLLREADMSNVKPGEIPGRRKPEVSRATCFVPGLAGT